MDIKLCNIIFFKKKRVITKNILLIKEQASYRKLFPIISNHKIKFLCIFSLHAFD